MRCCEAGSNVAVSSPVRTPVTGHKTEFWWGFTNAARLYRGASGRLGIDVARGRADVKALLDRAPVTGHNLDK